MNKIRLLFTILLVMMFAGCTASPSTLDSISTQRPPTEEITSLSTDDSSVHQASPINTLDSSEVTPPSPEMNPYVKLVEEDLASRLNISQEQIHFLKISDIDWQDITKGCTGSPGQTTTKGRRSGYRIWLDVNGKNYLYHIGTDNTIFLCPE